MKIPDLSKYKEKFTKNDFIEKIQRIAKRAGAKLVYAALILYYSIDSDKVSFKEKAIIIGALGYLITPLDIMPDAIPLAGLSDDLGVLIYVLRKVWDYVDDEAKQKAKDKLSQWFDKDEMKATENLFVDKIEDEPV
ncbi:YkvA family protein [Prevotella aurantiaca]|uniref:YkvA family protein n=1 Tax=Prevotella aurantiaca TaxID=596085 RepID=UPI0028E31679|nr:YkvA family protein [Prevotella aurantiaca]